MTTTITVDWMPVTFSWRITINDRVTWLTTGQFVTLLDLGVDILSACLGHDLTDEQVNFIQSSMLDKDNTLHD